MEPVSNDEKVVQLLSKLKNSDGGYPSDMLASRRKLFLRQVANVGMGIGIGTGIKNTMKGGNGAGATTTVTSKILETALIVAIAVEASTAAYLYRDKITDFVKTYTGSAQVQVVASPSKDTSSVANPALIETIETPSVTMTSGTPSGTPSGTSSPELAGNHNGDNDTSTIVGANATPGPQGNNGNQYGLTPKPVRTKENKINDIGNGGSGSNTNKP